MLGGWYIYYVAMYIYLLPIFLILITKHHTTQVSSKAIALSLVSVGFLTEFFGQYPTWFGKTGLTIMNVYMLLYYLIMVLTIYFVIKVSWNKKIKILIPAISLIIWFGFVIKLGLEDYDLFSYMGIITTIIPLVVSLVYYFKTFYEAKIKKLTDELGFWLISAIFISSGIVFFNSISESYILHENLMARLYILSIYWYATILFNLLLAFGIWRTRMT